MSTLAQYDHDPGLKGQVDMLNELADRRRVNNFFVNEQSVLYGVQKGYVNVGKGNFTFARRDLVTVGRLPVIVARVYDSSYAGPTDFSAGWRLSLAETIEVLENGSLEYIDDSLTHSRFAVSDSGYTISPWQPSDITRLETTADGYVVTYRNQWRKTFENLGDLARLTRVTDNNGNQITIDYDDQHRIQSVTGQNGRQVSISRNPAGQITGIVDDQGRAVAYGYGAIGSLVSVTDLGGREWTYKYANGLLHQVVDPKGQQAALLTYDNDGRVKHATIYRAKHSFSYDGQVTDVTDGAGNLSRFTQNASGITMRVVNPEGFESELTLNDQNEVATLRHQGGLRGTYSYDAARQLERLVRYHADGQVELTYLFNWRDRVVQITGTDGTQRTLNYDSAGNLIKKVENGVTTVYAYNPAGDVLSQSVGGEVTSYVHNDDGLLIRLLKDGASTQFDYTGSGRLSRITFPDGRSHSYQYDALGFRTRTERPDGSFLAYKYDSNGNLIEALGETPEGQQTGQQLAVGEDNLVTRISFPNRGPLDIEYDLLGNPTLLDWGDRTVACEYDPQGRLTRIDDSINGLTQYDYAPGEADIRKQLDDRTAGSLTDQRRSSATLRTISEAAYARPAGTPWLALAWMPGISVFDLPTEVGLVLPDVGHQSAEQRRRLYDAAAVSPDLQKHFDKASNSFFLPPEYATANCEWEDCWTGNPYLSGPSTATAGVAFSMTANVYSVGMDCQTILYTWYQGGSFAGWSESWLQDTQSYTINSPGTHSLSVMVMCGYCDSIPRYSGGHSVNVQSGPKVTVLSADLTAGSDGEITVKLEPNDISGALVLGLTTPDTHTILASPNVSGGTYTFPFNINSLPNGKEFNTVVATWSVTSPPTVGVKGYHFRVLGDINHTVYNSPAASDSTCTSGTSSTNYMVRESQPEVTNCWVPSSNYFTSSLTSVLKDQVTINGSGRLNSGKFFQIEKFCLTSQGNSGKPAAANSSNSYRERVNVLVPECGVGSPVNNSTLAVKLNEPVLKLSCGNEVFIKGVGLKVVTDECPGCGSDKIDNYTSSDTRCTGVTGLGVHKSIKIF